MNEKRLAQQANDLLVQLSEARRELYHHPQAIPYPRWKRRLARLGTITPRAFDRLKRRLEHVTADTEED